MKSVSRIFFLLIVLIGCKSSPEPESPVQDKLISVNYIGELKKNEILANAGDLLGANVALVSLLLQHDIKYYKVAYKTTTLDGQEIQASGALIIPSTKQQLPLLSLQHGTLFDESDAPSYFKEGTESTIGIILASAGFIIAMPDYVGYGDSRNYPHPYEHAEGLAAPNVDFLLAIKQHLSASTISWDNKLYLAGYSEGGYATLATQKLIEEKYLSVLPLKASACGAGAYNKSLFVEKLVSEPSAGETSQNRSYIWVVMAYNRIYNINQPMNYYFKEPYASQISKDGYTVSLKGSFNTLLNPTFVTNYKNSQENSLIALFKKNDLVNWKPSVKTLLVHGDADTYVPYYNSETTYEGMKAAGSINVTFDTIKGGTHESTIPQFLFKAYNFFSSNPS